MTDLLSNIIVLVEDRRFYKHVGIDLVAILRAFLINIREGRYAQGGSTITQQLARTLYLTPKKTILRKIKEIFIALWLEFRYDKGTILRLYTENVYMGQRKDGTEIRGFEAAAWTYFHVALNHTSMTQKAALVAMLRGPNTYRPSSKKGTARQAIVLGMMLEANLIDRDQFFEATELCSFIEAFGVNHG